METLNILDSQRRLARLVSDLKGYAMNHRKLAVLALLVVAVSQSGFGQGKPSVAVSNELIAAETEMFSKITQQDPAYMKDLIAEDYFSINADGTTVDKAQLLAQKGSPQQKMMAAATYTKCSIGGCALTGTWESSREERGLTWTALISWSFCTRLSSSNRTTSGCLLYGRELFQRILRSLRQCRKAASDIS